MTKVLLPEWWDDKRVMGFTDCVDTYCCSLKPCWYVNIPNYDYEGYFAVKDLTIIQED